MSLKAMCAVFATALKVLAIAGALLGASGVHASLIDVIVEGALSKSGVNVDVMKQFESKATVGTETEFHGTLTDVNKTLLTVDVDIVSLKNDPSAPQIVITTTAPPIGSAWGANDVIAGFSVNLSMLFWFGSSAAGMITNAQLMPPVGNQW